MTTRFEIRYVSRQWQPWELREAHSYESGWLRGPKTYWHCIKSFETRREAVAHMKAIVQGEKEREPEYFDERGEELTWAH